MSEIKKETVERIADKLSRTSNISREKAKQIVADVAEKSNKKQKGK